MGTVLVDQIASDGTLVSDVDTTLTVRQKNDLLLAALPGASVATYADEQVVRWKNQVILRKQVTHLGIPWDAFKKRIQIPRSWLAVHGEAAEEGLTTRFVGIYHYADVTIFVDFDPSTYVRGSANNSSAHVATNDLYQAQTLGSFSRTDRNGNRLTSVRLELFADYLLGHVSKNHPYLDTFEAFNAEFLDSKRLDALDAVREMHAAKWPDTFQTEWAGFYLEYRMDKFLRRTDAHRRVVFQKSKRQGDFDYDLVFVQGPQIAYYGDLKASNMDKHESPGNDADDIRRCIADYGRFWYVIYEHETWHSHDENDGPVIAWNEWRRSAGHVGRKGFDPLSYARRFKSAVRFKRMMILEVNEANFHIVLGQFKQGHQPDGAARALKVMIAKSNVDNFRIFSAAAPAEVVPSPATPDLAAGGASSSGLVGRVASSFTFVDLFAGIGGFHAALSQAGGQCVFVSEIDEQAMATYRHNWVDGQDDPPVLNSDITTAANDSVMAVPEHDVLTAGFPCQPFSKSGFQRGMDEARGTLFWNIAKILEKRRPSVVLLENVRNIAGPRHRHEWDVIITTLRELGYRVSSSPTVFSPHLLPPHLGGTPQVRDRVFIVGTYVGPVRAMEETEVGPTVLHAPVDGWDPARWDVNWVLDDDSAIPDVERYRLNDQEREWVQVWDDLVQAYRQSRGRRLPGFPLWSDLWKSEGMPSEFEIGAMPFWKADLTRKNIAFYRDNETLIDAWRSAHPSLVSFPAARRKLEWQAQEATSLWDTVMHFRPSGVRAKAAACLPALVAITQTSIVGSRRRRLTPHEAARLQGLPRSFEFANRREAASYKQVGNGVAVGAAWHVLRSHVENDAHSARPQVSERVRQAVLAAPLNASTDALSPLAHHLYPGS